MVDDSLLKTPYSRNVLWNGLYREQETSMLFLHNLGLCIR